jgi:hypothetical protein
MLLRSGLRKSLEQQLVLDGVDIGNANAIGYCRAGCRAAAGTDKHPEVAAGFYKIGNNEKVSGEAHGFDGVQLEVKPFFDLRADLFVAFAGAFERQVAQVIVL